MKIYKQIILAATIVLAVSSCYKEDPIVASSAEESGRFTFPQGDNDYDLELQQIFDEFGVKVIYKDFTNEDFNLSWTSLAVGKVGYDVSEDQQEEAADFMINHFFAFLTPEITENILPPYFYVADSIYTITSYSSGTTTLEIKSATTYNYSGLDFWCFTWNGAAGYMTLNGLLYSSTAPTLRPHDSYSYFYRRGVMLKEIYAEAVNNGIIEIPTGFSDGFDFSTAIKYRTGTEDDPDYYKARGFLGNMSSNVNFDFTTLYSVSSTNELKNFISYIDLCMRYTADSIEILYPEAKYPLIHEKYPVVIDYMEDEYGIDLTAIATKPTL